MLLFLLLVFLPCVAGEVLRWSGAFKSGILTAGGKALGDRHILRVIFAGDRGKESLLRNTLQATRSVGGFSTSSPLFEARKTACKLIGIRLDRAVGVSVCWLMLISAVSYCRFRGCHTAPQMFAMLAPLDLILCKMGKQNNIKRCQLRLPTWPFCLKTPHQRALSEIYVKISALRFPASRNRNTGTLIRYRASGFCVSRVSVAI